MKLPKITLVLVIALALKIFVFDGLFTDLFSHIGERAQTWWEIVSGQWLDRPYGVGVNRQSPEELLHAR